jgi:NTP-dependent ternary system trypsin peptidase co-occuring protein
MNDVVTLGRPITDDRRENIIMQVMSSTVRPGTNPVDAPGADVPGVLLEDVVQQVKDAFELIALDPGADLVPLKSLKMTLTSVLEWTISGGPKLKIPFLELELELGHSITREQTQTVEIELVPPKKEAEGLAPREALAPQLAEALRTIRRTVQAAAAKNPPLKLLEGSVELNLVVTRDSTAKLIVFSGERKDVTTQKLLVSVGGPD